MRNVSDKSCRGNQNTRLLFFSQKSCRYWDNVEKYSSAGLATDYNTAHAHCMLVTWGYRHTLGICNTYCVFPLQRWLHEHVSMLRYTHIACLDNIFCVVLKPRCFIRFEIGGKLKGRDRPLLSGLLISLFTLSVKGELLVCAPYVSVGQWRYTSTHSSRQQYIGWVNSFTPRPFYTHVNAVNA